MNNDERFRIGELISIYLGLKETNRIQFRHPQMLAVTLTAQWRPDQLLAAKRDLIEFDLEDMEGHYELPSAELPEEAGEGFVMEDRLEYLPGEPDWYVGMSNQFLRAIQGIDRKLRGRILEALGRITKEPTLPKGDTVKPLTHELKGLWRYRIGDYRLIYRPDIKNKRVVLVTFLSRGAAYG